MRNLLTGKRVLLTQAAEFMGPALREVLAEQGADVVASDEALSEPAREDAQFAAYLCSDAAACFVGQVFPVSGGWVTR